MKKTFNKCSEYRINVQITLYLNINNSIENEYLKIKLRKLL